MTSRDPKAHTHAAVAAEPGRRFSVAWELPPGEQGVEHLARVFRAAGEQQERAPAAPGETVARPSIEELAALARAEDKIISVCLDCGDPYRVRLSDGAIGGLSHGLCPACEG